MAIELYINDHKLKLESGRTIFEMAETKGIRVPTSCKKNGRCKECIVEIEEGKELLNPLTEEEEHLPNTKFRLACQCKIIAESGILKCHTLRRSAVVIEEEGLTPGVQNFQNDKRDPALTHKGDKVFLDGTEIDRNEKPVYGLALDIGTTTVVMRLVNLETFQVDATTSFENPQRFGGSDVIARIQYDTDHKGKLLQRTLTGYLSQAIEEFPVSGDQIYEIVVAGNATMRDLFFGLNVYPIGQKPYKSITELEMQTGKRDTTAVTTTAKKLRLPVNLKARVYGLPLVSGHVGADTSACLAAIGMMKEDRTMVLMDIGTNTEIVVVHKNRLVAASCPAGPAFEGGGIDWGVPGLEGAIERVWFDAHGNVRTKTIGESAPVGICGSGLIDALGELIVRSIINQFGRYEDGSDKYYLDSSIYISEADINELAQAKGANVAGLNIVLKHFGITTSDIDMFFVAGGFGKHLGIEHARRIGLIPNIEDAKIQKIGNASIEGVTQALLSKTIRKDLENLVKTISHIQLETDPDFFDHFVDGCQFMPMGQIDPLMK